MSSSQRKFSVDVLPAPSSAWRGQLRAVTCQRSPWASWGVKLRRTFLSNRSVVAMGSMNRMSRNSASAMSNPLSRRARNTMSRNTTPGMMRTPWTRWSRRMGLSFWRIALQVNVSGVRSTA
ncbi:hypothetical protein NR798_13760 [Archangium gephyra]